MARDTYVAQQKRIEKEIQRLQKQAQILKEKQRKPVIASIVKSMREYEITPEEITAAFERPKRGPARRPSNTVKKPVPPKYRNPETEQTWTGRGKAPRWITEAEAAGKSRDEFLINQADT